jgi:hypothetical protein
MEIQQKFQSPILGRGRLDTDVVSTRDVLFLLRKGRQAIGIYCEDNKKHVYTAVRQCCVM